MHTNNKSTPMSEQINAPSSGSATS